MFTIPVAYIPDIQVVVVAVVVAVVHSFPDMFHTVVDLAENFGSCTDLKDIFSVEYRLSQAQWVIGWLKLTN